MLSYSAWQAARTISCRSLDRAWNFSLLTTSSGAWAGSVKLGM